MPLVCYDVRRTGVTYRMSHMRVMAVYRPKCATVLQCYDARTTSIPSQCMCVVDRENLRHLASLRLSCVRTFAYLCVPLPILSLSWVDRHDCLSPSFAVLGELWVEVVLFQIAPHSVHPPQSGPSTRSPTFIVVTCFATFVSSLLITWPNHERRFWATYVVIGLTIASLLNFSFLIRSFLVLP